MRAQAGRQAVGPARTRVTLLLASSVDCGRFQAAPNTLRGVIRSADDWSGELPTGTSLLWGSWLPPPGPLLWITHRTPATLVAALLPTSRLPRPPSPTRLRPLALGLHTTPPRSPRLSRRHHGSHRTTSAALPQPTSHRSAASSRPHHAAHLAPRTTNLTPVHFHEVLSFQGLTERPF